MSEITLTTALQRIRAFYQTGATKSYTFRRQQLQLLKQAILKYEAEINHALFTDLKKGVEETYATETGLLLADITFTLKNLRSWMKPGRTSINLVNLPSSGKIYRDPLGVVLIIAPWNYPLQLLLIPLVGAIAGGNCAVLKPSEFAPATSAVIERIISAIYQPEYILMLQGNGAEIVPAAMQAIRFDHIFYTGSIAVGKAIYQLAAKDLVSVTLELGGKSPVVIEADADIDAAARRIAMGKFSNAGQTCIAPDYVLVHNSVKEKFIEKLKDTIRRFYGENAMMNDGYGKIINEKRFDVLVNYLGQGKITSGGKHDRKSLFIAPTIMEEVSLDEPVMNEEIFGPLLPVFGFSDMEEALSIVQKYPNPLGFYLFTSDQKKEMTWMEAVAFGGGCINNTIWHFANPHFPFGGIGNSGIGAYHGKYSFDTFTHAKPVMKTPTWFDPAIKYPPFKGKLKWFKMFIR